MLFVIEGPDRVGKSTMVGELQALIQMKHRKAITMHRGAPKPGDHPLTDYALPMSVYTPGGTSIIADRLHIGDLTYGPIYRGECRQTAEMVAWTTALIDTRGGVKIHMTANPDLIAIRIAEEGEDNSYLKVQDIRHVVETYRQITETGWVDMDTTLWNGIERTRESAGVVLDMAMQQEKIAKRIYDADQDYVGAEKPRILFVGDDSSSTRTKEDAGPDAKPSYAAFTPWEGSASEYFIGSLLKAGLSLSTDVGITTGANADLPFLWERLGQPKICAVGELGLLRLREANLDPGACINHPAHEMHFNRKKRAVYVELLKGITPLVPRRPVSSVWE